jgi:hypothetical protein
LNGQQELRRRIALLVEEMQGDHHRSHELFNYAWTMLCIEQNLMRVVRETWAHDTKCLVVEEVRSGRQHLVVRPSGLDAELEPLAVQALSHILSANRRAG